MQEPKHGVSVKEILQREPSFSLDRNPQAIVYSRNSKLQAVVLSRVLNSLLMSFVPTVPLSEFNLFVAPYAELSYVWAFIDNQDDLTRFTHVAKSLNVEATVFSPKGVKADVEFDEPYVLTSAVETIKAVLKNHPSSKRAETLWSALTPEGIEDYLRTKLVEIGDREPLVSPVFEPANEYIGIKSAFEEPSRKEVAIVASSADNLIVRKRTFELMRRGFSTKEVLIDVDPAIAPIYLLFLFS